MFEQKITTTKFLRPKSEKLNWGFGEDFAKEIMTELEKNRQYIVSNVLDDGPGFALWVNLKKERFWLTLNLIDSQQSLWEIKIVPVGIARITFFCIGRTFRGKRLVNDVERILNNIVI